jgi:Cof subfamily protein (haloacid dehalogenase superfamily)
VPFRLLALDVDGTLLDPRGSLSSAVRAAVRAVRERGIEVVLCTGRRFRTALPLLRELSLEGPVVVNNGVVVKDIASGRTLHQRYLTRDLLAELLNLVRGWGPPLVYVDAHERGLDFLTESPDQAHAFQREYLGDNTRFYRAVEDLRHCELENAILVSLMADEQRLRALRREAQRALGGRAQLHFLANKNYQGHILEFLSPQAGKWQALERVAREAGIPPSEIVAIGDDANDVDMIRGAGLGIAMGNAVAELRDVADHVTGHNAQDGVLEAIERFVLGG